MRVKIFGGLSSIFCLTTYDLECAQCGPIPSFLSTIGHSQALEIQNWLYLGSLHVQTTMHDGFRYNNQPNIDWSNFSGRSKSWLSISWWYEGSFIQMTFPFFLEKVFENYWLCMVRCVAPGKLWAHEPPPDDPIHLSIFAKIFGREAVYPGETTLMEWTKVVLIFYNIPFFFVFSFNWKGKLLAWLISFSFSPVSTVFFEFDVYYAAE